MRRAARFLKKHLLGNRILELPFDAPIKSDYPQVAPDVFHYLGRERHKLDVAQEKSNGCI
jgi:hypothetical protein